MQERVREECEVHGRAKVWKHLQDWQSIYLLLPLSVFSIWVYREVAFAIIGRRPTENADWMVGNAGNVMKLVYLIIFVEIFRQQTGHWLTKTESMNNPELARTQAFTKCVALVVGAYILSH